MTFDPNYPNAAQSPALFPTQNNTNNTRLKTIINADHVFNDSAQTTDGVHRQTTFISRAHPAVLLAGTNAILYSFVDAQARSQLWFYNGVADVQLTPPEELYPIRVVGSQNVGAGLSVTIYADPGFRWSGTGWSMISNSVIFRFYNLLRSGINDVHEIDSNAGAISRPTLTFLGNALQITNNEASAQILTWSLIINRIS
jgi:hypothetical protein